MSSDVVTYESHNNIATITINRPDKMNAFNPAVGEGFQAAWARLNESDDRVGIITGAGNRAFSAGADIGDPAENWAFMPGVGVKMEKPLIAAVNGWCIGIAVCLVQFCDLCVMAEEAKLSYPEAQLGFCGGLIASIVARIPHKIAMEMILVGEEMTAQRAYEIGFVNKVVPSDQLMDECLEWAEYMCTLGQPSVRAHKQMLYRGRNMSTTELQTLGRDLFYWYPPKPGVTIDATEGPRAFAEGRQAEYDEPG